MSHPAAERSKAMSALITMGAFLLPIGIFIAFISGTAADRSYQTGRYEVALGGYGTYLDMAGSQYAWMWVGVAIAALGGLTLLGVLFLHAAKER